MTEAVSGSRRPLSSSNGYFGRRTDLRDAFMMSEKAERAECPGGGGGGEEGALHRQQQQHRNPLWEKLEAGLAEVRGRLGLVEDGLRAVSAVREKVADLEDGVALLEGHAVAAARGHARVEQELEDVGQRLAAVEARAVERREAASEDERSGDCLGLRRRGRHLARSLTDLSERDSSGAAARRRRRRRSHGSFSSPLSSTSSASSSSSLSACAAAAAADATKTFLEAGRKEDDTEKSKTVAKAPSSEGRSHSSRFFFLDLPSSLPGIMRSKSFNDVRGGAGSKQLLQKQMTPPPQPPPVEEEEQEEQKSDFKAAAERPLKAGKGVQDFKAAAGRMSLQPQPSSPLLVIDSAEKPPRLQTRRPSSVRERQDGGGGRAISRHNNMSWNAVDFRERNLLPGRGGGGSGRGRDTKSLGAPSPDLRRSASVKV